MTNEVDVTEDGVPIKSSDTVFVRFIKKGKSQSEAEEAAYEVGRARAESIEGIIRHKVSKHIKKLLAWIGGLTTIALGIISVAATGKLTNILNAIVGN